MLRLQKYEYSFPPELIAQKPAVPRDAARLLVFKKKDLKRGDLIFFSRKGRGAAHVGIYLARGMIVHCSKARGGVSTELLDEMMQRYAAFMPFGYPWIAKRMRR